VLFPPRCAERAALGVLEMFTPEALSLAEGLVSPAYIAQGSQATARRSKLLTSLLSERRLPRVGWDDASIESFLHEAAMMDSNTFLDNVGVGEREARVHSPLVRRRHYGLAHGIGRSGDVAAEQPKAAGSSLLSKLTNLLVGDAFREAGLEDAGPALVLPLATGMTLTLTLLAMRALRGGNDGDRTRATRVIWCRLDQKTCVKAVVGAGLELVVAPQKLVGDQLETDLDAVRLAILDDAKGGPESVCCVVSSTSCFAPRASDDVVEIAKMCAELDVGHVVNNAYGVQSRRLCALVTKAWRRGRVDGVVQSTDKNFLVPVGGAVVVSPAKNGALTDAVRKNYPGRASIAPALDVLITLLSLGKNGWREKLEKREDAFEYMRERLRFTAEAHGERLLETPGNPISMGVTLSALERDLARIESGEARRDGRGDDDENENDKADANEPTTPTRRTIKTSVSFFGSMLFSRAVSGTRVVVPGKTQEVGGITFCGFGASHDAYPVPYFTAAAALGTTREDVDAFCARLARAFTDFRKKAKKEAARNRSEKNVSARASGAENGAE
jgi:O-phospho-L-seryl-tRNASec:L-selenocysteinyl-tRNA synthase